MPDCPRCDDDHVRGSQDCPGQRVGRIVAGKYKLVRLMGLGGMGAVYEAEHLALRKQVALKMLHPKFAGNPKLALRFHREAQQAAALGHPGIVDVRDLGEDLDGCPFLEMELLAGEGLGDLIRLGPLPIDRALDIAIQTLDALAVAHDKGIIHRDLKPENLFLAHTPKGEQVKILDFGIAKAIADIADTGLTRPGSLLGSPRYMSPDQIRDATGVDHRGDLYSMGAILYEMLTGRAPAGGATLLEVMANVAQGLVDQHPRKVRPEVPAWLDRVTARALAKLPEDRYQSARQMRTALMEGRHLPPDSTGEELPPAPGAGAMPLEPTVVLAPDPHPTPYPSARELLDVREQALEQARAAETLPTAPHRRLAPRRARWVWWMGLGLLLAAVGLGRWAWPHLHGARGASAAGRTEGGGAAATGGTGSLALAAPPVGMVRLPAAEFLMGSPPDAIEQGFEWCRRLAGEGCRRDVYEREQPPHRVAVSAFFLDRTEVTNARYATWLTSARDLEIREGRIYQGGALLVDLHPAQGGLRLRDGRYEARPGRAELPVIQVTWQGAERFCEAQGGRLPTEAEWERAARGPEERPFPWGAREPQCSEVVFGRTEDGPCRALAGTAPAPVGATAGDRTPEGILDLGGNVGEWVRDEFRDRYPGCEPCRDPVVEPAAAPGGGPLWRVVRGGTWDGLAEACRSPGRSRVEQDQVRVNVGFRCARPEVP